MTWNGAHPAFSKAEARRLLPPGACKVCVYKLRAFLLKPSMSCYFPRDVCDRCGIIVYFDEIAWRRKGSR